MKATGSLTVKKHFNTKSCLVGIADQEKSTLNFWKKERIFQQTLEKTKNKKPYVMYDGPPFATGLPHYGHVLAHTIKDVIPRFKTMNNRFVYRPFGWDCHGVPVEHGVQMDCLSKGIELDTSTPEGIADFNERCRSVVLKYTKEWAVAEARIGRFVDMDNDYKTMHARYIESVWSVFKRLYEKGLVYESNRVVAYSPALHTPLSDFEAKSNYKKLHDPQVFVTFPLKNDTKTSLLVWTTTPWSLITNVGIAVHPDIPYVKITTHEGQSYILSQTLAPKHFSEDVIAKEEALTADKLIGLKYSPLFCTANPEESSENLYTIISSQHVTDLDGTGLVHISPAFGEDDFQVGKKYNIPALDYFDANGCFQEIAHFNDENKQQYVDFYNQLQGIEFKKADKIVIQFIKRDLKRMFSHSTIMHEYPCCWRTDKPLMYRAIPAWYVEVTKIKERMRYHNNTINWYPDNVGHKRFDKWLENARDWNISRNRFWGAPIPIWRNVNDSSDIKVIGSKAELESYSGATIDDMHRHNIDNIVITHESKTYKRISEVFDCWFESGSMPYGQVHYPFDFASDEEFFQHHFPADFIAEGLDQTRGWFYTLLILSTALFDKPAFKNCIVNGILLGDDGKKMSKSKNNFPPLNDVLDRYGADALRYVLLKSPATRAEAMSIQTNLFRGATRDLLLPIINVYRFFAETCNKYQITQQDLLSLEGVKNSPLDTWLVVTTEMFRQKITQHLENYQLMLACNALQEYVDGLSKWYVRNIKAILSEADQVQQQLSMSSMYFSLETLSKCAAPIIPFMSEFIYRNIFGMNQSVHLQQWPEMLDATFRESLNEIADKVNYVREIVSLIYVLRDDHSLPLRQPLRKITLDVKLKEKLQGYEGIILQATNVLNIQWSEADDRFEAHVTLNNKVLGPKFRRELGKIISALKSNDFCLQDDGLTLLIANHELKASKEDYTVSMKPKVGTHGGRSERTWAVLDTTLTEDLLNQGRLRALEREVMLARNDLGLTHNDSIEIYIDGNFSKIISDHALSFQQKTRSILLNDQPKQGADHVIQIERLNRENHFNGFISVYCPQIKSVDIRKKESSPLTGMTSTIWATTKTPANTPTLKDGTKKPSNCRPATQ